MNKMKIGPSTSMDLMNMMDEKKAGKKGKPAGKKKMAKKKGKMPKGKPMFGKY